MSSANFKPKRTAAASRGFLATARFSSDVTRKHYQRSANRSFYSATADVCKTSHFSVDPTGHTHCISSPSGRAGTTRSPRNKTDLTAVHETRNYWRHNRLDEENGTPSRENVVRHTDQPWRPGDSRTSTLVVATSAVHVTCIHMTKSQSKGHVAPDL